MRSLTHLAVGSLLVVVYLILVVMIWLMLLISLHVHPRNADGVAQAHVVACAQAGETAHVITHAQAIAASYVRDQVQCGRTAHAVLHTSDDQLQSAITACAKGSNVSPSDGAA
eukprot:4937786-Karenia_brevis.AAC.1